MKKEMWQVGGGEPKEAEDVCLGTMTVFYCRI